MKLKFYAALFAVLWTVPSFSAEITYLGMADENVLCLELTDGKAVHNHSGYGRIEDALLNQNELKKTSSYAISGGIYGAGKAPLSVGIKFKGTEFVKAGDWKFLPRYTYWIYLKLPEKFEEGAKYKVSIASASTGGEELSKEFEFNSSTLRSESIHCSQFGFLPDSPKSAFLSCWAGTLGPLDMAKTAKKGFRVIDEKGGTAFEGEIKLRSSKNEGKDDAYKSNYQGCDLYEMDFSGLKKPGRYKISVPGLGSSFPFEIGADVYSEPYKVTTRGLYYQRCGCELDAAHAGKEWARPICHHPKDGVEETDLPLTSCQMGGGSANQFQELPKHLTGKKLQFFGGWHDAGDFDRRAGHLFPAVMLLDVYEIFPDSFKDGDLNIPESGNGIPDIVDEALWCIDFFKSGQREDGAVRGGIESEDHPPHNCTSWTDPLHLYAYGVDAQTSYNYAWASAKSAKIISKMKGQQERAASYMKSAESAWNWALKNDGGKFHDEKNAAAAELLAASGKEEYARAFAETSIWTGNPDSVPEQYGKFDQRKGAFSYLFDTAPDKRDEKLMDSARKSLIKLADERLDVAEKRGFRFASSYWRPMNWGLGACPDVWDIVRAFAITREKKYADAIERSSAFTLGGNPLNIVWVSGLGENRVSQILHTDSWYMQEKNGLKDPVPGLVPSGPVKFRDESKGIHGFTQKSFSPPMKNWPPLEQYAGNRYDPAMNEHTPVSIGMAALAYDFLYGYGKACGKKSSH